MGPTLVWSLRWLLIEPVSFCVVQDLPLQEAIR